MPVCKWPNDRNRTPHGLRDSQSGRHPNGIRVSPFGFLVPSFSSQLYFDSPSLSPSLLVHDFPCPNDAIRASRPHFLFVRILSSTPLPGFIGPESSVLPVNLPPSGPYPLRGLLIGIGFLKSVAAFNFKPGGLPETFEFWRNWQIIASATKFDKICHQILNFCPGPKPDLSSNLLSA